MINHSVNRSLDDKAMDAIDHALGRPVDPMSESYRNYYCAAIGGREAAAFRASPHWSEMKGPNAGDSYFLVTDAGRKALAKHLKKIQDPHRSYDVEVKNWDDCPKFINVVASSRSAAKFEVFRLLSDVDHSLTFERFIFNHLGSVFVAPQATQSASP